MTRKRKWQFSFWPVLAFVCVLPMLLALGAWQVSRGLEKQQVYADFAAPGSRVEAIDATGFDLEKLNALPAYAVASWQGEYLDEQTFLLDNMSYQGRPGHHVLTPFKPDGANYLVIVDRGWRPGITSRKEANEVPPANATHVNGKLATFPQPGLTLEGKPVADGPWPRVVQFPRAGELAMQLQQPVAHRRVLLDENAAGGFVRDWQAPGIPPARHFAYAFQWFGLAAALIVIFVIMARPRRAEDDSE